MYALHRPDMFSSAAPLSASTGTRTVEQFKARMRRRGNPIPDVSDAVLEEYISRHNAVSLIENLPAEKQEDYAALTRSLDEAFKRYEQLIRKTESDTASVKRSSKKQPPKETSG